ncbi:MAG: hypothetical protein HC828_03480 [Blastochloris sp.]|nr:hypothetical protein [Blastochloris sp.]
MSADPNLAAMLTHLLGGTALIAGELAHSAGVTPQTASAYLSRSIVRPSTAIFTLT